MRDRGHSFRAISGAQVTSVSAGGLPMNRLLHIVAIALVLAIATTVTIVVPAAAALAAMG